MLFRKFLKYVGPSARGMLGTSCYILADTFFVSLALGSAGLAALNFSIPVFSVIQGVGLMVGIGGATKFSLDRAREDAGKGGRAFSLSLFLCACFSLVFGLSSFAAAPLASLLGAEGETGNLAAVYLGTLLAFSPAFLANNLVLAFVRNDGGPRLAMAAMLASSFSNILLDYLFMFPLGMGIFGAALATGISPLLSLCVLALHLRRGRPGFCRPALRFRFRTREIGGVLALGFSSFVGELASAVVLIAFNYAILPREGDVGVAAYGVVANLALVATAVLTGVAQGAQPLMSDCCGRGEGRSVRKLLAFACLTAAVLALLFYAVVLGFAEPIVELFNSERNARLAELAERGARIYFSGFLFAGINIVAAAALSALARPGRGMAVALLRGCFVILPAVFALSAALGMTGIWLAFPVTEGIVCLLSGFFLLRLIRRKEIFLSAA